MGRGPVTPRLSPTLLRAGLACAALGVAFVGALLVTSGRGAGWALIVCGVPLAGALALAGDALGPEFRGVLGARSSALGAQTRPWMWWLALYVAMKVPVPLWPQGFAQLGLISTAALFASAFLFVWERENVVKALMLAGLALGVGLGVEVLGSRSGFPFGQYSYAGAPAPTLLGVPLIVPLGWFALTLAATALAGGRAWLAGLLLALWDVGLEPLMTAQGFWQWHDPRPLWAGAPLQNFLGWWGVGSGLAWVFAGVAPRLFGLLRDEWAWALPWFARTLPDAALPRLSLLPRPALSGLGFWVAYPVEAFFLPGGLLLVGRPAEAAVTLLAMGLGLGLARAVRRA